MPKHTREGEMHGVRRYRPRPMHERERELRLSMRERESYTCEGEHLSVYVTAHDGWVASGCPSPLPSRP